MTSLRSIIVVSLSLVASAALADLNASLQDYLKGGDAIVAQLTVMKDYAGTCGFVGRMVAGRMADSIDQQRKQMKTVSAAVKRGSAGRAEVQEQLDAVEDGNNELRSNQSMIRNGLSTNTPDCQKASVAFEKMVPLSFGQSAKIKSILSQL